MGLTVTQLRDFHLQIVRQQRAIERPSTADESFRRVMEQFKKRKANLCSAR